MVRESAARAVSEVLDRFHSTGGVRMRFSVAEIPDQEDWGTADSLRAIKTRVKVGEIIVCTNIQVCLSEKDKNIAFGVSNFVSRLPCIASFSGFPQLRLLLLEPQPGKAWEQGYPCTRVGE